MLNGSSSWSSSSSSSSTFLRGLRRVGLVRFSSSSSSSYPYSCSASSGSSAGCSTTSHNEAVGRVSRLGARWVRMSQILAPCSSSATISLWLRVWDAIYATMDPREGFCLNPWTSGDSLCRLANSAGWLNRVCSVIMCVDIEYMAPEAANRCLDRVYNVSSSMNFMKVTRSHSSGSSAVAESFLLKRCRTCRTGLALFISTSTACRVKTLSRYSARVAMLEYNVSANSLIA